MLEPWIQWLTIYNGKKANEHKIIRLGDGVNCNFNSIFKDLENKGISVGAISPMNIGNNLKTPKYFYQIHGRKLKFLEDFGLI